MMYEYQCTDKECGHKFDWIVKDMDEPVRCEKCGAEAKRVRIPLSKTGKHSSWPVK
jgi:putative FmdB family regulatory protein